LPSQKPNYGIDAPPVVRNLGIAGACCITLGVILYLILHNWDHLLADIFLFVMLFSALCFLLTIGAMIWSSKRGKLIARKRLIDSLELLGGETILDVGCGRGLLLNYAAKKLTTGKAIGLDLWQNQDQSGNAPEVALSNAKLEGVADRVEIMSGDMRQIPLPNASVDVVISSIAIHNIQDRSGREKAISEIHRVLRSGGKVLLLDFQNVEEYKDTLCSLGWTKVKVSRPTFWFFPPVRTVRGSRPEPT
jgi:arsenite methyltransferase